MFRVNVNFWYWRAAIFGGNFNNEVRAGVFALNLNNAPSNSNYNIGFRACNANRQTIRHYP